MRSASKGIGRSPLGRLIQAFAIGWSIGELLDSMLGISTLISDQAARANLLDVTQLDINTWSLVQRLAAAGDPLCMELERRQQQLADLENRGARVLNEAVGSREAAVNMDNDDLQVVGARSVRAEALRDMRARLEAGESFNGVVAAWRGRLPPELEPVDGEQNATRRRLRELHDQLDDHIESLRDLDSRTQAQALHLIAVWRA
jgi:hypothetical protein